MAAVMEALTERPTGIQLSFDFEAVLWTAEDIETLQKFLFKRSIAALSYKNASRQTVEDILHWVYEPNQSHDFCFRNCCEAAGWNPHNLRMALAWKALKIHRIRIVVD